MSNEFVRYQEAGDGFGVGSLIFVVFGVCGETYPRCQYAECIVQKVVGGLPFQSFPFKVQPKVVQDRVANRLGSMSAPSAVGAEDAKAIRISTIFAMSSSELKTLMALVIMPQVEIMLSFRSSSDETAAASSAPVTWGLEPWHRHRSRMSILRRFVAVLRAKSGQDEAIVSIRRTRFGR